MYFVYILQSLKTGNYYIGQTQDVAQRLLRHNSKHVPATSKKGPWRLIWSIEQQDRVSAVILEKKLKNLKSRVRLERFMEKYGEKVSDPDSDNLA